MIRQKIYLQALHLVIAIVALIFLPLLSGAQKRASKADTSLPKSPQADANGPSSPISAPPIELKGMTLSKLAKALKAQNKRLVASEFSGHAILKIEYPYYRVVRELPPKRRSSNDNVVVRVFAEPLPRYVMGY
jgi:hypothetical protein